MFSKFFAALTGKPLANEQSDNEKYNIPYGLAIMASDAISSVSYAAQEILFVLIVLGPLAYHWLAWTSFMIIGLLIILTVSYIQIIRAYPQGGGAYKVGKENLGPIPGLIAGAGLIIDYTLTVAVSASAGADAIISAFQELAPYKVEIVIGVIFVLTLLNLRGISESSRIFAIPTYMFVVSMLIMIVYGLFKYFVLHIEPQAEFDIPTQATKDVSLLLILRAFSSGCSALTGLESVSNSVPNFKPDSQRNAKIVMLLLAGLITLIFGGTAILSIYYKAVPIENGPTVISQIATGVFGKTFMYYVLQFCTALILLMACNTSFSGYPMLMYVIGRDGYAPRQFTQRGKRLDFSYGIVSLSVCAGILVIIFHANTHGLIPLYALGVFTSFTIGQFGMVNHWRKSKEKGWRRSMAINGLGAIVTTATTLIILVEKFTAGAFVVVIAIPIIVAISLAIKHHYNRVAAGLSVSGLDLSTLDLKKHTEDHIVIVPIASLNKAVIGALRYAQSIGGLVYALNVSTDKEAMEKLKCQWEKLDTDVILLAEYSPYREVMNPLVKYISMLADAAEWHERVTVIVPQFITHGVFEGILHNHTGFLLHEALLKNENVVVATYPYHLKANADDYTVAREDLPAPGASHKINKK